MIRNCVLMSLVPQLISVIVVHQRDPPPPRCLITVMVASIFSLPQCQQMNVENPRVTEEAMILACKLIDHFDEIERHDPEYALEERVKALFISQIMWFRGLKYQLFHNMLVIKEYLV